MAMKLVLLLLLNNLYVIRYSVFGIPYTQQIYTDGKRATALSISAIYNDIIYNKKNELFWWGGGGGSFGKLHMHIYLLSS